MRKPSEMYIASRMQNMVQVCKKNAYFVTNLVLHFKKCSFGALGVESPNGGAILEADRFYVLASLISDSVSF